MNSHVSLVKLFWNFQCVMSFSHLFQPTGALGFTPKSHNSIPYEFPMGPFKEPFFSAAPKSVAHLLGLQQRRLDGHLQRNASLQAVALRPAGRQQLQPCRVTIASHVLPGAGYTGWRWMFAGIYIYIDLYIPQCVCACVILM